MCRGCAGYGARVLRPMSNYAVTRLVSLQRGLQELKPFVKDDARYLRVGRGIRNFGRMLPREFLGNWLVCAASSGDVTGPYTFTSDPMGGDGIILDESTGDTFPTEHVSVILPPDAPDPDGQAEQLILAAIEQKNNAAYSGKTLIVFNETPAGSWLPNTVTRALPPDLHVAVVWVVGLQFVDADGTYVYGVTLLHLGPYIDAPTFLVRVAPDFGSWRVERLQ